MSEVLAEMSLWADVAAELRTRGIKGCRQSPGGCPITKYLVGEIPGGIFSTVPSAPESGWAGCVSKYGRKMERDKYPIPRNLDVFVKEFDSGQYPDLACGPKDWTPDWAGSSVGRRDRRRPVVDGSDVRAARAVGPLAHFICPHCHIGSDVAHTELLPAKTDEILGTISLIAGERALLSSGEIREWTGRLWKSIPGDWRPRRPGWR